MIETTRPRINPAYLVIAVTLALVGLVYLFPAIPQDANYHQFADARTLFGVPNALNVISNLPFILVGLLGISEVFRRVQSENTNVSMFPYLFLFFGIGITAFGSGYYHWEPNSETLFWDRLPMSIAFMALLSCIISDRWNERLGRLLLFPLVAFGIWSVWYWKQTEAIGQGDLRPYVITQFGGIILIGLIMFLFPQNTLRNRPMIYAMIWYGLAKVFEAADGLFFSAGELVSGHSIKHVAAAVGTYWIYKSFRTSTTR